ncbi:MAG: TolC family protein [Cyanobacteria bacterium REEB67]|nr:TolC family protein [Cyanobacteria bacterium REEB67]
MKKKTNPKLTNLLLILLASTCPLTKALAQPESGSATPPTPELRPAIKAGDLPDPQNSPLRQSGQASAREAMEADFSEHKKSIVGPKNTSTSKVPSGASGQKTAPVLSTLKQNVPGPSTTSNTPAVIDSIELKQPALQSLISVNDYLNPFALDASSSASLNLRRALKIGLEQNLDLAISRTNTKQKQFAYYSALGNFLPDPTLGFSEYFPRGHVGLPISASTLFGGSSALSGAASSSALLASNAANNTISIHRNFDIMHAGGEFYAYRGGSILFGALQSKHTLKAAKFQEKATLSDTLLAITQNYYNCVLAESILQIRVDAVRTSMEQLRRNQDRFHSGLATNLDVLQSKTQLSRDKQALLDQQAARRAAAITLAQSLYYNLGEDLLPIEPIVKKIRLVDSRLTVADILQLALDNRPELKRYEELRLAAKRSIMVAAAKLQPTVLLSGQAYGIGPTNNVQALGLFSVAVNWRLKGMGTVDAFNVQQARWTAHQSKLEAEKEMQTVLGQVRNAYVQILDKEKNIEEASNEVESALEELRLAELRKSSGLGLNLDIITAQRDYTQAQVDKAQAIINFDIAQAQLVHDMGLISIEAVTSGRLLSKAVQ